MSTVSQEGMNFEQSVASIVQQIKIKVDESETLHTELIRIDREIIAHTAKRDQILSTLSHKYHMLSNWNSILYQQIKCVNQNQKVQAQALIAERQQVQKYLENLGYLIGEAKHLHMQIKSGKPKLTKPYDQIASQVSNQSKLLAGILKPRSPTVTFSDELEQKPSITK